MVSYPCGRIELLFFLCIVGHAADVTFLQRLDGASLSGSAATKEENADNSQVSNDATEETNYAVDAQHGEESEGASASDAHADDTSESEEEESEEADGEHADPKGAKVGEGQQDAESETVKHSAKADSSHKAAAGKQWPAPRVPSMSVVGGKSKELSGTHEAGAVASEESIPTTDALAAELGQMQRDMREANARLAVSWDAPRRDMTGGSGKKSEPDDSSRSLEDAYDDMHYLSREVLQKSNAHESDSPAGAQGSGPTSERQVAEAESSSTLKSKAKAHGNSLKANRGPGTPPDSKSDNAPSQELPVIVDSHIGMATSPPARFKALRTLRAAKRFLRDHAPSQESVNTGESRAEELATHFATQFATQSPSEGTDVSEADGEAASIGDAAASMHASMAKAEAEVTMFLMQKKQTGE